MKWNKKKWTSKHIDILKIKYPEKGSNIPELLEEFTKGAIRYKAYSLNIGKNNSSKKHTNESFDLKLNKKDIKYTRVGDYKGSSSKIEFQCHTCSNIWRAIPNSILGGSGCPNCAPSGFNFQLNAFLYFIEITTPWDSFLKVGVTNKDIKYRLAQLKAASRAIKIELIHITTNTGLYIYEIEQKIHKQFQHYIPQIKFAGYTECFSLDLKKEILHDIHIFSSTR